MNIHSSDENKVTEQSAEEKHIPQKETFVLNVVKGLPFDPVQVYLDSYTFLFKNMLQKKTLSVEEKKNFQNQLFFDASKEDFQSYIEEERNFFKGLKLLSEPVEKKGNAHLFYVSALDKFYWLNETNGIVTGRACKKRFWLKIAEDKKDFFNHLSFADKDGHMFLKVSGADKQTVYTAYFKDYILEHKVNANQSEMNIYRLADGHQVKKDRKIFQGSFYKILDSIKSKTETF